MTALIAVGGEAPPLSRAAFLLPLADLVCAADSGLDLLRSWKVLPDLIVGDMDSLSDPSLLAGYPEDRIHRLPRAKDESDTEAALRLCAGRGAGRFIIVGGGGGRLDHLLALRALFERSLRPSEWHLAEDSVYLVEAGSSRTFATGAGALVSVFPLAGGSGSMRSRGLRWPLEGLAWDSGGLGLSNEAVDAEVEIGAGRGDLLVVRSWRGGET